MTAAASDTPNDPIYVDFSPAPLDTKNETLLKNSPTGVLEWKGASVDGHWFLACASSDPDLISNDDEACVSGPDSKDRKKRDWIAGARQVFASIGVASVNDTTCVSFMAAAIDYVEGHVEV